MPTISDSPRSAGSSTTRKLSTTPRSAAGGGSSRSVSSTPRAAARNSLLPWITPESQRATTDFIGRAQRARVGVGPGFTPVRVVLDAASTPAYMVGNYARGRPDQALLNLVSLGQRGDKTFLSRTPVVSKGLEKIPGPSWLQSGVGLGLDIATDPTTYVTFGAGGAARGAAGKAAKSAQARAAANLEEAAARATAAGRRLPSAREVAEIAVEAAEAARQAPRTFKVNLRTPLTRNKTRLIAESRTVARAAESVIEPVRGSTVGVALRRIFRADQGTDPALYEGRRAVRYWAEATQRVIRQSIDRERKYAKTLGVDSERITRHLDQPQAYPARTAEEADVFARAAGLRDEIEQIARDAGVEMGLVENYVMHLPKTPKDEKRLAEAFQRMYGSKPENAAYTKRRAFLNLDQWEIAGITPELDVWRLFDVRSGQGIRDAAVKGYMDMAAARGVKPLPLNPVDVGGQAIRVSELESGLTESMKKVGTKAERKAAKQAKQAVKFAQRAVRVAQEANDPAAIARATRALQMAEEAATPAAILSAPARGAEGTVGDVLSSSLDDLGTLARSRSASAARLPEPTAGRYARPADPSRTPARLTGRARNLARRATELRASVERDIRQEVKDFRAQRESLRPAKGAGGYGTSHQRGTSAQKDGIHGKTDAPDYVRAPHIDDYNTIQPKRTYVSKKGKNKGKVITKAAHSRPKTVDEYREEYLRDLLNTAEEQGVEVLTEAQRRIYDALDEAGALERQAEEISTALRNAEGGAFGEADEVAGRARVGELAADLPAERVNMRARRERGAARHGDQETPRAARNATADGPRKGTPKAARARFRRYFTGQGPLTDAIEAVKLGAETEIRAATNAARRQVTKARAGYERALKSGDEEAVRFARRMLADAQRTERSVSAELARAKAVYGATPRQVAAKVRELIREQRLLTIMEKRARRVTEHNEKLRARPGREVDDYEEYRSLLAEGWQGHTSKYHKGTLLDPVTHEAVRKVDAEVTRLLTRNDEVAAFTRFFNQAGSAWKGLQLATPRYHVRNLFDDGFADWLAGARNPLSYVQAARVLRGTSGPIKTKVGTFTPEQIVAMAEAQGVMHMGFAAWEVGKQMERGVKIGSRATVRAPGSGRIARGSRHIGEIREDWSRLGLFIEMLRKGEDPVQAGLTVRRYRYDYSDMAPFLMNARAVALPFLTFTWKTIPMLSKQLAERPGTFSRINMVAEYLQEVSGDPDRSMLAPWESDSFGVPAPEALKGAFGAEEGEPVFFNPRITLRYADFEMFNPKPDAITRNWLGMVGPIKAPVEALTGYSTFQARQLRPGERVRAPGVITALESAGVPIPGWGPKRDSFTGEQVPGYSARLHNILSTLPPFQHSTSLVPTGTGDEAWQRKFAAFMTGLNLRPEDHARSVHFAEKYGNR